MARQDIERQKLLEPERMDYAIRMLNSMGYSTVCMRGNEIKFTFKGNTIKLFPYSGYFNGKGVIAGRGINKLLTQLK